MWRTRHGTTVDAMVRILVVDAFDSFVYIIKQYLMSAGADPIVLRSNELTPATVHELAPDALLLGPGPGHPADSGHVELVTEFAGRVPIFGVCLGHQAIGLAYGASVVPAQRLMHGKSSPVRHDARGVFRGMPQLFSATRYHSLVVPEETVPGVLAVTARAVGDDYVMGLRHKELPIESVQFHPESVGAEDGLRMFANFLNDVKGFRVHAA
jgi:anthranilate synthase/aminodeoxychorismate synthase-like glutamine amidotransferase